MNSDLKFWIAFSQIYQIGPARFKKLYGYFPTMEKAWQADFSELQKSGLEEKIAQEIVNRRPEINPALEEEKLAKEHIQAITIQEENYPKMLKEIYNPPALLYYKGNLERQDEFSIAVVGTRKITNYGKQATSQITGGLVQAGITIISGLALGVDSLAHLSTLENSGRTIAVLGSGIDQQNIYPSANRYLADKIVAGGGAVITEYPLGTLPLKHHFPQRNRIISGLSLGTLVIEANEESGALITAKCALEQNREVFALPGSIYNPSSIGPNNLIKMGAHPIVSAQDILDDLNLTQVKTFVETQKISPDSQEEAQILKHLSREPIHIDQLARAANLPSSQVSATLSIMEMKGKIKNLGGMNYVLAR